MNPDTPTELSFEESIATLLGEVPLVVRNFILNELPQKTQDLMGRYQLHVDQGGVLERELLLMLLGQEDPAAFITSLQASGIAPQTVQTIVTDINTEIFMKLRSTEEKGGASGALPAISTPPPVPAISVPPVTVPTPPPAPPKPAPMAPPVPPSIPVSNPIAPPIMHTMQNDMAAAKTGHTAQYESPQPQQQSVAAAMPTATPPMPKPQQQTQQKPPLIKEYGSDPYREPIS